ncbi:DNA phosphorothioation-dependent restriction protein DptH [Paraburkholderia terricola]|uniref:DNA phosphorothioation-dependent restriction protein DptH n=1 Tax=Paraburkholderia terricola TaxID=169427 RepID=UPI0028611F94|nr:DNA phosphorothioation-dependent restriction protein DptH [Paraburkholderia terricola]MDR6492805.1 DNA phosphorothioation-dependent restriction protein DptH [Paraburkholderia terricola]
MSEKQFEHFLADHFLQWVSPEIQPGFRYQFKSPDVHNARSLHDAFLSMSSARTIKIDDIDLPCVECCGVQLIPVLHGEDGNGFTENYISRLRDEVASRRGSFAPSALLIIHNSMLDTLINSARDVAAPGAIWHPEFFKDKLAELISPNGKKRELSRCLLDDQLSIVTEDGATVFGLAPLYRMLEDGELDFRELGLFNDPMLLSMTGQLAQIQRRLEDNRGLHRRIEFAVDHYSDQLDGALREYSAKFIKEHFEDTRDWRDLDFQKYLDEQKANQVEGITLESVTVDSGEIFQRARGQTKTALKDISLLVQVPPGSNEVVLELTFSGNDVAADQLKVTHNRALARSTQVSVNRAGGKRSRVSVVVPYSTTPVFFTLELKRENRSEEHKFRCLILEQGRFYLEEAKNCFRVDPLRGWMTLLLEENQFKISESGGGTLVLEQDDDEVDCNTYGRVDFQRLAEQTEMIQFGLRSGEQLLPINIEGPAAEEGLTVPLLFDQDRFARLLRDDSNAEFNRAKNKVVIDNTETSVIGIRLQLLVAEARLVDERSVYIDGIEAMPLGALQEFAPKLHAAYSGLFDYLDHHRTLPSLVSWGPRFSELAQAVVDTYEEALSAIPRNHVLAPNHKRVLKVGLYVQERRERISPLHPLILSYYLNLVKHIEADRDAAGHSTFVDLPDVTLDRLVASGLLPFVYDPKSDFAHIVPIRENAFWLDVIPQRQVSHSYVRRLVTDKIGEFTYAYARLFSSGPRSALIINAINQSDARELFFGLADFFKQHKDATCPIHVNFYDDKLTYNEFDRFSETASYDQLKNRLGLHSAAYRADADMLIDLLRSRLTSSKFVTPKNGQQLAYAHLAFFRNSAPVDCRPVNIEDALSGVLCDGLIVGEAAETKHGSYFTSFGLRGVDTAKSQVLRLAKLVGNLWQPARQSNAQYLGTGIGLAVSADFQELLSRSYDSALWTTIIDPKVTLDFFAAQKGVVLLHYSDQYTSSAGYDAITVTRQVDLFRRLLKKESQADSDNLLAEFNAFNGEWLLKLLTSNAKQRKEKHGIIGAYKFVSALLNHSNISWVPLSVAEMIRVSGNIGLKMSESDFSRKEQGYRKGAISDDVLFVGFRGKEMYLLPLEVKTGARPDFAYAGQQALELKRYLVDDVLGPRRLASQLYRSLFVRQVLMQVEKFRLYGVLSDESLGELIQHREWWLNGEFRLATLPDYVDGFVVAHVDDPTCFEPHYKITADRLLQIELPYALLGALISAEGHDKLDDLIQICMVKEEYLLTPQRAMNIQHVPIEAGGTIVEANSPLNQPENPENERSNLTTPLVGEVGRPLERKSETENKSSTEPLKVLFGQDVLRNMPLYWEPTNTAKFMNTNTGIIGTMGTGKTQFTKSLVTQLVRNQDKNVNASPIGILIFDYKSDYVDDPFIKATGAKKFKLFKLPYNPLSLYGDTPMLPVHTAAGFAETMSRAYGLGKKQQLKLENLVLECYEAAGIRSEDPSTWGRAAPTIEDIWQRFLDQEKVEEDSLYAALSKLARFKIFESVADCMTSLYELVSGVTIVELAGYPSEVQNLIVALTLDLFYSQMQKKGKPQITGDFRQITKMILVDEADNFMSQDFQSLRKILKEGREYGVGVILSTQDITHFRTNENNYATYVLTWIVHRVSEIRNLDIKAIFNKDDKAEQDQLMESIRKLEKHFSLFVDGAKQVIKMRDKAFWEL